jgi:hypothetical protein
MNPPQAQAYCDELHEVERGAAGDELPNRFDDELGIVGPVHDCAAGLPEQAR